MLTAVSRHPLLTAFGAVAATGAAAAAWGIGIERHLYALREMSARVLRPDATPIRILHLSDAHLAPWQSRRAEWIAALAALGPDLIINTGDNLGHPEALPALRRAMMPFAGIPGVFVHGSNDRFASAPRNPFTYFFGPSKARAKDAIEMDWPAMDRFFTDELGWTDLNNTAARLTVAGRRVDFFGVSDAHRDWDELEALPAALRKIRAKDALRLGVTHAPYRRVLDAFVDLGAEAIFAGHTHGGQVCLPGFGTLVANCDIPLSQAKGLSRWSHDGRDVPLHVSAGLGHSIYAPVRFACRPEATLLTLEPRFA